MFPLFELAKILSLPASNQGKYGDNVKILKSAWKELGERFSLSLFLSNDALIVASGTHEDPLSTRQVAWYTNNPVTSMCYDPSGTWILCTLQHALCIVPSQKIIDPSAMVSGPWNPGDITRFKMSPQKGEITASYWWQSWDGSQFALIGTRLGFVVVISLKKGDRVTEFDVHDVVSSISVVLDDNQTETYALITTRNACQWKLLLELRGDLSISVDEQRELDAQGFETISSNRSSAIYQHIGELAQMFRPIKFHQFNSSINLTAQYAKGRHLIAAHDMKSSLYQVYDSNVQRSPLYEYRVLPQTKQIVFTDKLMFTTYYTEPSSLSVASNQLSEVDEEQSEELNKNAVIQQFEFKTAERIITIYNKSYPFYWHEKQSNAHDDIPEDGEQIGCISQEPVPSHTVLDGCVVLTNCGIYLCRPRISPERYFLDMAVKQNESSITEMFGIILGLDLNLLYKILAEFYVKQNNIAKCMKYLQLGKCGHTQRVKLFLQHGYLKEAMSLLLQTDQATDPINYSGELANLTLQCYIQQIAQSDMNVDTVDDIKTQFREFLLGNYSFDKDEALEMLAKYGMSDLLLEFALERGFCSQALKVMLEIGNTNLSRVYTKAVEAQGLAPLLSRDMNEAFLGTIQQLLTEDTLIEVLSQDANLTTYLVNQLQPLLSSCQDESLLIWLVRIFDPSKPTMQDILTTLLRKHKTNIKTASTSSLESFSSMDSTLTSSSDVFPNDNVKMIHKLINFFLYAVILLNDRRPRKKKGDLFNFTWTDSFGIFNKPLPVQKKLVHHHSLVSCGSAHTAVVSDSNLYIWGAKSYARLGIGETGKYNEYEHRPNRVATFSLLKLKVLAVACGSQHNLALTDRGVYSWGGNQYGQLGIGNRTTQTVPVHVPSLRDAMVVKLSCGQYHSLAVTADCKVYSWGWGVHGQLGHGMVEDELEPRKIYELRGVLIVTVAGGYGHSLACSKQGDVYSFGNNTFGQLGTGDEEKQTIPRKIHLMTDQIKVVATQFFHNVAVSSGGRVISWGSSPAVYKQKVALIRQNRMLGKPRPSSPLESCRRPMVVDTNMVQGRTVKVACGLNFSVLLTHDGEVYTWGSNAEGQLGVPAQHDMKYPTQVSKLTDVKITHISAGPDFLVNMDTEAGLWVWGRNDSGQLALKPTKPQRRPGPERVANRASKRAAQEASCCVMIPTHIESVRLTLQDSFDLSGSLSSYKGKLFKKYIQLVPIEWWFDTPQSKSSRSEFAISSLEAGGSDAPYPVEVILKVLKELPQYCDVQALHHWCIDYKYWDMAAHLCQHLNSFPQAFHYHILYVQQNRVLCELDDFAKTVIMLLEFYIKGAHEVGQRSNPTNRKQKITNLISMLQEVTEMWLNEDMPLEEFERYILENYELLACPQFIIMSRLDNSPHSKQLEMFSTSFFLSLTEHVFTITGTDPFYESIIVEHGALPVATLETSSLGIKQEEKLLPKDKLWEDIFQNINKGIETRSCITLNKQDMASLVSSQRNINSTEERRADSSQFESHVRLFTCGHNYPENYFIDKILPEIDVSLKHNGIPLQLSASLLSGYYKSDDVQAMACPRCVVAALRTSQD